MRLHTTDLKDVFLLEPPAFDDERGTFVVSYNEEALQKVGIQGPFIQDNESLSLKAGTLRGLHFQLEPDAQTKIVRCTAGAIFDVVVDLRPDSDTFGTWRGFHLSAENRLQLVVPKGFAHGFCTLLPHTVVAYKVDAPYAATHEAGIRWDDPDLNIDWPIKDPILSEKDRALPKLTEARLQL